MREVGGQSEDQEWIEGSQDQDSQGAWYGLGYGHHVSYIYDYNGDDDGHVINVDGDQKGPGQPRKTPIL